MQPIKGDHVLSSVEIKNAGKLPEEKKGRSYAKTDARYWILPGRLFKDHGVPNYSCRFSVRGQREQICLATPNQKDAAKRAAELVSLVIADGWPAGFALYRPAARIEKPQVVTVGMLIETASKVSSARRDSVNGYAKALRLIASDIFDVNGHGKFDAHGGGAKDWRARVDAIPLHTITPAEVLAWRNARIRLTDGDPPARRRAVVTTNSLIRNAKTLFGKKTLSFVEQTLPLLRPLPFEEVPLNKAPSLRYISRMDPAAILKKAKDELAAPEPEMFKVLILALIFGLRRAEIDNLLWAAFDFQAALLRVETSEFHELKSEDSAGAIDLDEASLALFRGYFAQAPQDIFVIKSHLEPVKSPKPGRYRCNPVFTRVLVWLRENGVNGHKPLHTLRKEIGSIIASEQGIFAASRYLRHADIHITSAIYADKKKAVTPMAFAGLLLSEEVGRPTAPGNSALAKFE